MTVQTNTNVASFNGNGVTQIFPIAFKFNNASDLVVLLVDDATGAALQLTLNSDYTVSGEGDNAGGLINAVVAPASGKSLIVTRIVDILQLTDLRNQGKFFPEVHENAFDLLTMIAQQQQTEIDSAIRVATSDPAPARLPPAQSRANQLMGFDSFGNPIAVAPASGSAEELALDLANAVDPAKGAGKIGYNGHTVAAELGDQAQLIQDLDDGLAILSGEVEDLTRINQAQPLMARSNKVLALGQGVVIIGDSISAGAYFGNAYTNGWPDLLAKAINDQFGAKNIGARPMDSLYSTNSANITNQIHAVTWSGDWGTRSTSPAPYDYPLGNTGAAAGDAVNGKTVTSSELGAYVEIVVPSINGIASVFYVGRPDGGKFDITVNGTLQTELDTLMATTTYNQVKNISAFDNGQGECTIRLTKKDSSPTELQSVVKYTKSAGSSVDHFGLMTVDNFSISGRQLARMSEAGIIRATNCACLIVALGHNDRTAETNEAYHADFLQRVNWLIHYANINDCLVVVNDFCWYSAPTSRVRTELRRIAQETNGIYIPFPDKFYPDGAIPVDTTPTSSELVTPLRLLADNSHPNYKGNEMIFTQVARALGLSVTSKRQALISDMPYPLKLVGTLRNKSGKISTVSRVDSGLMYSLGVTAAGGGTIPVGTVAVATLPAKFAPAPTLRQATQINTVAGTAIGSHVVIAEDGAVSATIGTAAEIACTVVAAERP